MIGNGAGSGSDFIDLKHCSVLLSPDGGHGSCPETSQKLGTPLFCAALPGCLHLGKKKSE